MSTSEFPIYAALAAFIAWSVIERAFSLSGRQQRGGAVLERGSYRLISLAWYAVVLVSLLDAFSLGWTLLPPAWRALRWCGIPLALLGLYLRVRARRDLGAQYSVQVETSAAHRLVTVGVYRRIRHPAYLGLLCLLFGIPLCAGSLAGLLSAAACGVPALVHRIRIEEEALQAWFGESYRTYAGQTSRLIPGVW